MAHSALVQVKEEEKKNPYRPLSDLGICCMCPALTACIQQLECFSSKQRLLKKRNTPTPGPVCMRANANFVECLTKKKKGKKPLFSYICFWWEMDNKMKVRSWPAPEQGVLLLPPLMP